MRETQLHDAHLLNETVAFRATLATGEGAFLIARVTLEDLQGMYFDEDRQMLEAFEFNRARIARAVEKVISGNQMPMDGPATVLTAVQFSEPY